MLDATLMCVIRKALKQLPLGQEETRIFESWRDTCKGGILESGNPPDTKQAVFDAVHKTNTLKELEKLFDSLYAPVLPVSEPGDRRQLPLFVDKKNNPAAIETSLGKMDARFELWELDDLIPSHNPLEQFAKREDYPENVQERPYHSDSGEQDKVRRNAANLNPRYLINTNPDAMSGPPVVTSRGVVLGGNSRTMSMQLAYDSFPDRAREYKEYLADMAPFFGFSPAQVQGMKKPTLVRVVSQGMETNEEMAQASRRFNEVTTQSLQAAAEGVSKSKLISGHTLGIVQTDLQEFETLREFLSSPKSKELLDSLVQDGVIEQVQVSRITNNEGLLNSEGKDLVENTLRGLIVQDYDLIRKTPASIMDKIDRSIPSLSQLKGKGDNWDLSPVIMKALKQIQIALDGGFTLKTLPAYFGQVQMIPDPDRSNKAVQAIALTLLNGSSKEVTARFTAFANEANKNSGGGGGFASLLGAVPGQSAEDAFKKAMFRPLASVGGKPVPNFRPDRVESHEAIQWAYNATRSHTVEAAMGVLEDIYTSSASTPEEKEKARERMGHLSRYQGTIVLYDLKLGDFFHFRPGEDKLFQENA